MSDEVVFHIDLKPAIDKIKLALNDFSKEIQDRALYNAINFVGGPLTTAVRRHVAQQSGAKYGRVMRAIVPKKAHPGRLEYRIEAKDVAMPLIDFVRGARAGRQNVRANPWNQARVFPKTFIAPVYGKLQVLKRVTPHASHSGPLGVKVLWGPIIPKEMLRPNTPSFRELEAAVPVKLVPRVLHELGQAAARAKAASGT